MTSDPCVARLLTLAFLVHCGSAQEPLAALVKQAQRSVVTVFARDEGTQGTGFFIRPQVLLTNSHVVRDSHDLAAENIEGDTITIESVLVNDPQRDLAILRTRAAGHPLPLAANLPEAGERVFVVGSPLGFAQTVTDGIVSAVRQVPTEGLLLQISAPISEGSSGSPVINSSGAVVGVATFKIIGGESLNFAIPAQYAAEMLQRVADRAGPPMPQQQSSALPPPAKDPFVEGMGLVMREDYAGALPFLELAAAKNPKYADTWFYMGLSQSKVGRFQQAIDSYRLALRIKPDADTFYNLGLCFLNLYQPDEELKAFQAAVALKPGFAKAHFEIGNVRAFRKEIVEAEQSYKLAIQSKPNYEDAYLALAALYEGQKRRAEEIGTLQEFLKSVPSSVQGHYRLALAFLATDDRPSALQEYVLLKGVDQAQAEQLYRQIYK